MTIEFEDYLTRDLMKQGKKIRHDNGWISLHTDYINNKESDGFHVTFVNGSDDPSNSPEAIQREQERLRIDELREKLKNRTISQPELFELLDKVI